ncbi:MAG: hypothetical protein AMXMBFR13_07020 [Phycisphaerae bacterium]
MPYLTKLCLSQYIRTECRRQLRLTLSPDNSAYQPERTAQGMPPTQPPRPGLQEIVEAGREWEEEKLNDLTLTLGTGALRGDARVTSSNRTVYRPVPLAGALTGIVPGQFIAQAKYDVTPAFEAAMNIAAIRTRFNLDYANVVPDLLQVFAPGTFDRMVLPDGELIPVPQHDTRLQLRVIEVKLTAEPSPSYFAEVVYYSLVLAGWLREHANGDQFLVVPNGAVWPGSHDASRLVTVFRQAAAQGGTATLQQLLAALEEDLEAVPFEVFAFRVRRFLQHDVPGVLGQTWQSMEWHVDNRCKGCDYLGYPWTNSQGQRTNHPDHCIPTAEVSEHLSRVAFLTRGASAALQARQVTRVSDLAALQPTSSAFDAHQALRATRSVVTGRAQSLQTQQAAIPPDAGTSAVMPRWADLRVYLSVDFDVSSAITVAFGLKAFWLEPRAFGAAPPVGGRPHAEWQEVFPVDQKDIMTEQRELLALLDRLNTILTDARNRHPNTTVQVYLWDPLQYDHLTRVIGRHLQAILANRSIQHLAWLFPPEELLPDPTTALHRSPLTVVKDVVRSVLAVPIPHYYSLFQIARIYHHAGLHATVAQFSVHPLFEDPLSDQIPSERAHEIWARSTAPRHWRAQLQTLDETIRKRLSALETVVRRLETDLRPVLNAKAPDIRIGPPQRQPRLSADGQLWHAFAKLDDALSELEVHKIRAMPPHEREARFHSARLVRRLTGQDEQAALGALNLPAQQGRRVYELSTSSCEVKLREGDFGFAMAPASAANFLDQPLTLMVRGTPLEAQYANHWRTRMEDVTSVTIAGVSRENRLIAVDLNAYWLAKVTDLEANGIVTLAAEVMLDPVHKDFFTRKLLDTLATIGNPPGAGRNPLVLRATGQLTGTGARATAPVPAADLLWHAPQMHATAIARPLASIRQLLERSGVTLNSSQWRGWEAALSRRLQLIWGPPGTGKSRTARAVVLGAALSAQDQRQPVRVLICASTYTAVDNVLLDVFTGAQRILPAGSYEVRRLRSEYRLIDPAVPPQIDLEVNRRQPSAEVQALRGRLTGRTGITIVGATPEQVHNLLTVDDDPPCQEFFDLILIDEATQMDVCHSILAVGALAANGSVVLAGDHLQLPPIQKAEPPSRLEGMVGSIYNFCRDLHGVQPEMLDQNYRSNRVLVDFCREAGYRSALASWSPDLALDLVSPLPTSRPGNWPTDLHWCPEWASLLDPAQPAVCFVYQEGRSSQSNRFEADAVSALIWLLHGRLADRLQNERDPAGRTIPRSTTPYTPQEFWEKAVGVVTPHRAQQGLVVSRLQQLFASTGVDQRAIRNAVDTVERFQGQQRDVIIASFALGDPDQIGEEDEFLLSLNRFNVMASRARAKLVVLVSQEVVDHLSGELDVLRESRLLKVFAQSFCNRSREISLSVVEGGLVRQVPGLLRHHV